MRIPLGTVLAALVLLTPTAAHAAPEPDPGRTVTMATSTALARLPVRSEDRTGYRRDSFRHWIDEDGDGCDTRREVLLAEAAEPPTVSGRCTLTGGAWYSAYDSRRFDGAAGLDIDHLVPLAEAWDSGAGSWSPAERQAFANDLGDGRDLIAVSAASNRAKADRDPAQWLPPSGDYVCTYVTDWIADKTRWQLSVDTAEAAALRDALTRCDESDLTVEYAR